MTQNSLQQAGHRAAEVKVVMDQGFLIFKTEITSSPGEGGAKGGEFGAGRAGSVWGWKGLLEALEGLGLEDLEYLGL